jgi:hypothetical protein
MKSMQLATQPCDMILRRLAQLDSELRRARTELKNLRHRDPATAEVVMRGARLSRERAALERQLELLRLNSTQATRYSN